MKRLRSFIMEYKVDLHSHSIISQDGGITADSYATLLSERILDRIAVTDHNRIDFALSLHKKLGQGIIVGEEIMTSQGEITGLFLRRPIPPFLSPKETVTQIHGQNGLVYIPHPFELRRKGLGMTILEQLKADIDIMEVFNGRSLQNSTARRARVFAGENHIAQAASSDAHSARGLGSTYTVVNAAPTRDTILSLLAHAVLSQKRPPLYTFFSPAYNRMKKYLAKSHGR